MLQSPITKLSDNFCGSTMWFTGSYYFVHDYYIIMSSGKKEPSQKRYVKSRKGRSHIRRKNRKNRKGSRYCRNISATKIQKMFRSYMVYRYMKLAPTNYSDCDYIDMEKISSIPKGLLVSINGTGYNAVSLLKWFSCSQIDPVTRKRVGDEVPVECAVKLIYFMENDHLFRKRKGHFSNYRSYIKVLMACMGNKRR